MVAPAVALAIEVPRCRTVGRELMLVLRCTQKLLVRLKQVGDLPPVESTTRLGDWYGNILRIGRRQHLLFISGTVSASGCPSARRGEAAGRRVSGRGVREAGHRRRRG
jgi:hypothetical protein